MSTFCTLVRRPDETSGEFNTRLNAACREAPVTDFEASVVDGLPVVTLISSLVEPDEDMLAQAEADGNPLKKGELVPEEEPIIIQVCELGAIKAISGDCENRMDVLNKRAKGEAAGVEHITGPNVQWIPDANDAGAKPRLVMIQTQSVYAVVSYFYDPTEKIEERRK